MKKLHYYLLYSHPMYLGGEMKRFSFLEDFTVKRERERYLKWILNNYKNVVYTEFEEYVENGRIVNG